MTTDEGAWSKPVAVDDCIAEVGWCEGLKDGHNAPKYLGIEEWRDSL